MTAPFAAAFAKGDPASLAASLLAQLPRGAGAGLGILYVSEAAGPALPQLVADLAAGSGVTAWVGGVGLGVCAGGEEVYDAPAAAVLMAPLPAESFRLFGATDDPTAALPRRHAAWIERVTPSLALVHGDPRSQDLPQAIVDVAAASGAFLVGGLVSHRCAEPLLAGDVTGNRPVCGKGAIAGLLLAPEVAVATGLTQGCTPIGPTHRVDDARDNVIMAIDGRPALGVLYDDIGPELAKEPQRLGGIIFAGLPVAGSDTGDYLVRNLMAIDPGRGWIVLGAEVAPGDQILFCRRDPESARTDLGRMLRQLKGRLPGPPKAGVYVSCIARGIALFDEPGVETGQIRDVFGEFPLVGFFANGEISRDRLYGHTGVLTLFT